MNYATHKISLDIHKPESQAVLHMKRTDTGRKIKISLTEDGRPYILTPDCSAVFKAKKPDGHNIEVDCAVDGNVIIHTVSFQTTASLGEVECEIMLYNESGMLITSPRFVIIVNDTVQSEGSIAESDSEASIKFNKLLKSKLKTAVEEHFEENPVKEISEKQEKNIEENTKARHSHENADVLENLADDNGTLTYNGKAISATGGTTLKSKTYTVGVDGDITTDVTDPACIEFYIFEPLENALLIDIRFTYNSEDVGTADFLLNGTINGQDILEIFPIANNEYGMVARIVSNGGNSSELVNQIQSYQTPITAFTIYYIGVTTE